MIVVHKGRAYVINPDDESVPTFVGDEASFYPCRYKAASATVDGLAKVAHAGCNDALAREAGMLKRIHEAVNEEYANYIVQPAASVVADGTRITVMPAYKGWYSLEDLLQAFPDGMDPRDVAWIWRRLLVALGTVSQLGVCHNAVLPQHVLIEPEDHGLVLIDWCYSTAIGEKVPAVVRTHRDWYPGSLYMTKAASPAYDVRMGARCMIALLGGDPVTGEVPPAVDDDYGKQLLRIADEWEWPNGWFPRGVVPRGGDGWHAWSLQKEFDELLERLWGRRRYRPLSVPTPARLP